MSTKEIILAIENKLSHFTDKELLETLSFVEKVEKGKSLDYDIEQEADQILREDIELFKRLAQ